MKHIFDGPQEIIKHYKADSLEDALHAIYDKGTSFMISVSEDDSQMMVSRTYGRILIDFPIEKDLLEHQIKEFASKEDFS